MQFQYPLNLHCSQTQREHMALSRRFNTLWIYTALKLWGDSRMELLSFNTIWIYTALKLLRFWKNPLKVSIPSEFTLLSNLVNSAIAESWFQYPLNLHCSQTSARLSKTTPSFNTLWIYTALKQISFPLIYNHCFNTLWIYTALKQHLLYSRKRNSFNTLWIYTALKPNQFHILSSSVSIPSEFTLLSNKIKTFCV